MSKTWDVVIKILAGGVIAGGLGWGSYLSGQIDTTRVAYQTTDQVLMQRGYDNAQKIAVLEAQYRGIKESLDRIELKLDTQKEVKKNGY